MNKKAIIVSVVILMTAVIAGGFWYVKNQDKNNIIDSVQSLEDTHKKQDGTGENVKGIEELNFDEVDTSDWKTYRNEEYGFEMRYPNYLEIKSNDAQFPLIDGDSKEIAIMFNGEEELKNATISWQYYWLSYVNGEDMNKRMSFLIGLDKNFSTGKVTNSMKIKKNQGFTANDVSYTSFDYYPNLHGALADVRISEYFIDAGESGYIHVRTNSWYFDEEKEKTLKMIIQTFGRL